MKKAYLTILITFMVLGASQLTSNAIVYYRDMSYNQIHTVYTCQFREETCTVYKVSYMQRNLAYYEAKCTGNSFEQSRNSKAAETDVRRKLYHHCTMVK